MKKRRFIQIQNPKSRRYALIDKLRGIILWHSNPSKPFHRIPIVGYKKEMRRNEKTRDTKTCI